MRCKANFMNVASKNYATNPLRGDDYKDFKVACMSYILIRLRA